MPRTLTPDAIAQLEAVAKAPVLLFTGQFLSGPIYFWTGLGTLSWNGQNWQGTGSLVKIETANETVDPVAQLVTLIVSGIDPGIMALVLEECGHNLTGTLYLGFLGPSGLIDTPFPIFSGLLDTPQIIEAVAGPQLRLSYANRLADMERPRLRNYTQADQQMTYPDDLGFQFVPEVQEWNGRWES